MEPAAAIASAQCPNDERFSESGRKFRHWASRYQTLRMKFLMKMRKQNRLLGTETAAVWRTVNYDSANRKALGLQSPFLHHFTLEHDQIDLDVLELVERGIFL